MFLIIINKKTTDIFFVAEYEFVKWIFLFTSLLEMRIGGETEILLLSGFQGNKLNTHDI